MRFAKGRGAMPKVLREQYVPPIIAADAAARTLTYVFSDESVGRDQNIVKTSGWQLANFLRNPVALWAHDAESPPIGRVIDIGATGAVLRGTIEFAERDVYPFADTIFQLAKAEFLNAVSVCFLPLKWTYTADRSRPGGIDISQAELLEVSVVPVPALPTALASGRSAGIDVTPFAGWAERALDGGMTTTLPRKELEMVRKAAGAPAMFSGAGIETAEDRKRKAQARASAQGRGEFESFGHFLRAAAQAASQSVGEDPRLQREMARTATGAGEVDPTAGGFLVPTNYSTELIESLYAEAVVASLCDRRPTNRPTNAILPAIDETSRANGSRQGGTIAYWASEGVAAGTTFPRFRAVTFYAHRLIAQAVVTTELLEDAPLLDSHMRAVFNAEAVFMLDQAILAGTGTGTPLGVIASPGTVTIAKENGQAAGTIERVNIAKMWSALPAPCRKRAVWLCNEDFEERLSLQSATDQFGAMYTPQGVGGNAYPLLRGRPLLVAEQCPAMGTPGDIVLADFSQYVIIDGGLQASLSVHVLFVSDQAVFKFVLRVDGKPLWPKPITPANGSATLRSPFVILAQR